MHKDLSECDSVINALNTASILTHFISSDLASLFRSDGIEPLKVRIGIDLGFKEDVLWSHYGIPDCSELTTTSLHTDLVAKLQASANSNEILVGENVKNILDINANFCQDCTNNLGNLDLYIYKGYKNYRKFNFNWKNYLNTFDFVKKQNNSLVIEESRIKLVCTIKENEYADEIEYYQNSRAIKKGFIIKYSIVENNIPYKKKDNERIAWKVFNSGKEAKRAGQLNLDIGECATGGINISLVSAYTGHHYIQCTINNEVLNTKKELTFAIFVK